MQRKDQKRRASHARWQVTNFAIYNIKGSTKIIFIKAGKPL